MTTKGYGTKIALLLANVTNCTMLHKITCITLTTKIHSQYKRADLDGNSTSSGTMVTVKSLALHKIPLGVAFVRANIY